MRILTNILFGTPLPQGQLSTKMLSAPAADRNKEPMLQVLKEVLPAGALKVLEIASGTGQHIVHFAQSLTNITWQPTEFEDRSIASIKAFIAHHDLRNVNPPVFVDVSRPISEWSQEVAEKGSYDVVLCTNMIHISPWACTVGLFTAAASLIKPKGLLVTYGPYAVNGVLTPESNINFDRGLRAQNPEWGVRDVNDLEKLAQANNFQLTKTVEMPANNKILVFKKLD